MGKCLIFQKDRYKAGYEDGKNDIHIVQIRPISRFDSGTYNASGTVYGASRLMLVIDADDLYGENSLFTFKCNGNTLFNKSAGPWKSYTSENRYTGCYTQMYNIPSPTTSSLILESNGNDGVISGAIIWLE